MAPRGIWIRRKRRHAASGERGFPYGNRLQQIERLELRIRLRRLLFALLAFPSIALLAALAYLVVGD